jgi:hypothetical protein
MDGALKSRREAEVTSRPGETEAGWRIKEASIQGVSYYIKEKPELLFRQQASALFVFIIIKNQINHKNHSLVSKLCPGHGA